MSIQRLVLGIESSCDETSVAVVADDRRVLSHLVFSQLKEHEIYGGVVPEIAARSHEFHLQSLIERAVREAGISPSDLTAIAATTGPGLIGGVMVGMMAGKALSLGLQIPFLGINHLEAHILTARLSHNVAFPYLCLLVSGGHTQIICVHGLGHYEIWGSTRDDAAGECFDKSAKMMGLPFPGGPHLEKMAARCDDITRAQERFPFSIPMQQHADIVFSFSGLKTAVRNYVAALTHTSDAPDNNQSTIHESDLIDLCASFQMIIGKTISFRLTQALEKFKTVYPASPSPIPLVICGGVAANSVIRAQILKTAEDHNADFIAPPRELCTDNGAMIAWAGMEYHLHHYQSPLNLKARPRWPLDDLGLRWKITV